MRYDLIHIIAIALLCCFAFNGCRAKKNIEKNETTVERTERVERTVDTTRTMETEEFKTERSGSESEQVFTRVIEYDTTGRVQRISETWRDRQQGSLVVQERSAQAVSLTGESKEIIERDTTATVMNETVKINADSRPVQGVEWIWVILSIALIAAVVLYIIYNKVR